MPPFRLTLPWRRLIYAQSVNHLFINGAWTSGIMVSEPRRTADSQGQLCFMLKIFWQPTWRASQRGVGLYHNFTLQGHSRAHGVHGLHFQHSHGGTSWKSLSRCNHALGFGMGFGKQGGKGKPRVWWRKRSKDCVIPEPLRNGAAEYARHGRISGSTYPCTWEASLLNIV